MKSNLQHEFGINVITYATGRQLNEKLDTPRVLAGNALGPARD